MAENGTELKGDNRLVVELAAGKTVRDAAKSAGLSERTAYRRLEDDEFRKHIRQTRGEMFERGLGMLADATTAAVQTIRDLLNSDSDSIRLSASRSILDLGHRMREQLELAAEVEEMKRTINEYIRDNRNDNQTRRPEFAKVC